MSETLSLRREVEMAENYNKYRPAYQEVAIPRLLEYYRLKHPSSAGSKIPLAIDVACGTGQLSGQLASCCDRVIAIDVSKVMLDAAKHHNNYPNVEYRVECAENLNQVCAEKQADVITVGMAIHSFDKESFYSKVRQALKPGGVFGVFGYFIPGIQIKGHETFLTEFFEEQVSNSPFLDTFLGLKRGYKGLHLPFKEQERWESQRLIPTSREGLKQVLISLSYVMRDGEEGIEKRIRRVPPNTTFDMICNVFGLLSQV